MAADEARTEQSASEKAGYEWFLGTDFMKNLTVLWEGVEHVAAATAENEGLNPDEFMSGAANAFEEALSDFLFGEEEEGEDENPA